MKILCTGDLHIGRRPTRLPDDADAATLSSARTWESIVEKAIAEGVHVVALSGDIIDESNRYYEAIGPVEAGVRRLAAHGIRTVAVAGNHDHEALRWLATSLEPEHFTLLGAAGDWERLTIAGDGRPALIIEGWSFSERFQVTDPLAEYALPPAASSAPVLRLLHCDLDQPASQYAPVRLQDVYARGPAFWLLGHIHAPRLLAAPGHPTVLYPGSPQPLDPGEPGLHGPWLVEVEGGHFHARQVPLATVRYEQLEVDIGGAADPGEVGRRVHRTLATAVDDCVADGCGPLRHLIARVILTGRTELYRDLDTVADGLRAITATAGDVTAVIDRVVRRARPARDLSALANGSDAPAELARLILALENGEISAKEEGLIRTIRQATEDARSAPVYSALPREEAELGPAEARQILAETAGVLLEELLVQKEVA